MPGPRCSQLSGSQRQLPAHGRWASTQGHSGPHHFMAALRPSPGGPFTHTTAPPRARRRAASWRPDGGPGAPSPTLPSSLAVTQAATSSPLPAKRLLVVESGPLSGEAALPPTPPRPRGDRGSCAGNLRYPGPALQLPAVCGARSRMLGITPETAPPVAAARAWGRGSLPTCHVTHKDTQGAPGASLLWRRLAAPESGMPVLQAGEWI